MTLPKRLRPHNRFDRKLLGKLCTCAWTSIKAEVQRLLGRDDVVPGMIAAMVVPFIADSGEFYSTTESTSRFHTRRK